MKNVNMKVVVAILLFGVLMMLIGCDRESPEETLERANYFRLLKLKKYFINKGKEDNRFLSNADAQNLMENEGWTDIIYHYDSKRELFILCSPGYDKLWGTEDDLIVSSKTKSKWEKLLDKYDDN